MFLDPRADGRLIHQRRPPDNDRCRDTVRVSRHHLRRGRSERAREALRHGVAMIPPRAERPHVQGVEQRSIGGDVERRRRLEANLLPDGRLGGRIERSDTAVGFGGTRARAFARAGPPPSSRSCGQLLAHLGAPDPEDRVDLIAAESIDHIR